MGIRLHEKERDGTVESRRIPGEPLIRILGERVIMQRRSESIEKTKRGEMK